MYKAAEDGLHQKAGLYINVLFEDGRYKDEGTCSIPSAG